MIGSNNATNKPNTHTKDSRHMAAVPALNAAKQTAQTLDGVHFKREKKAVIAGATLASPAGRVLQVADVFVPRSNIDKSRSLPAQFRYLNRKVVVFANGAIAPLQDIKAHYRIIA